MRFLAELIQFNLPDLLFQIKARPMLADYLLNKQQGVFIEGFRTPRLIA